MAEVRRFIKEGLEPIDTAISKVSGISTVERPEKHLTTTFPTDRTTVKMDEVHLNTDSEPYVESQKLQLAVNLQRIGEASVDVTRSPVTQNSPAQNRVITHAVTTNQ